MQRRKRDQSCFLLFLFFISILGMFLILFSTSKYGPGLNPDSVEYIRLARTFNTNGYHVLFEEPISLLQPPLYPILLSLVSRMIGNDPVEATRYFNVFLIGFLLIFSGMIVARHTRSYPFLKYIAILLIIFSIPLFEDAIMVWTEILFILLIVCFFLCLELFLENNKMIFLILTYIIIVLSFLTRYIGIVLIPTAFLSVLMHSKYKIRKRLLVAFGYSISSMIPMILWLLRNRHVSGSFFGERFQSMFSLSYNLNYGFNNILRWFIPDKIVNSLPLLIIAFMIFGYLLCHFKINIFQRLKTKSFLQIVPLILFILFYSIFVFGLSTYTAVDRLGNRLLSPLFIPLVLILLFLYQSLVDHFQTSHNKKLLCAVLFILFLIQPVNDYRKEIIDKHEHGIRDYNNDLWRQSNIINYLQNNGLNIYEKPIFSNDPFVLYILCNIPAKLSPQKFRYHSHEIANQLSEIKDVYPEFINSYLIWLDNHLSDCPYTVEELKSIATAELLNEFSDGKIFKISPKNHENQ